MLSVAPPYLDHALDLPLDFPLDTPLDVATFNDILARIKAMSPLVATDSRLLNPANAGRPLSGGDVATFDGSTQYVTTSYVLPVSTSFTYSEWVKPSVGTSTKILVDARDSAGDGPVVNISSAGEFAFSVNEAQVSSATGFNDDTWHFVEAVYDGVTMVLKVDGVTVDSTAETSTINTTTPVKIGSRSFSTAARFFKGKRANVNINGTTFPLGETTGATALDSSGNGNHGTYVNNPTLNVPDNTVPYSAWNQLGGSERMYFDGVDDIVMLDSSFELEDGKFLEFTVVPESFAATSFLLGQSTAISKGVISTTSGEVRLLAATTSTTYTTLIFNIGEKNILRLERTGNDIECTLNGLSENNTFTDASMIFQVVGGKAGSYFGGIIYNVNLNDQASYLGLNATNAGWLDQIGSNNGTVTGGSTIRIPRNESNTAQDVLGNAVQYSGSAYPVLPNITGGTAEALTAFNTNISTSSTQPPEILAAAIPATWVHADGSVPLLQVKDNGDSTSSLALGFEDAPTAPEQLTIDEYYA